MSQNFRERLSFSGQDSFTKGRENWQNALVLLSQPIQEQREDHLILQELLALPHHPEEQKLPYLEWLITKDSDSTQVFLIPHLIDDTASYRIPSLSYLQNYEGLVSFDRAWALFFAKHFCRDGTKVELSSSAAIKEIFFTLARAKRLRLGSCNTFLCVEQPLQLEARLRFAEEWNLWALDAELITDDGVCIRPGALDFMVSSGLVVYEGRLFTLPVGATWVAQLLVSGVWYIAKENIGECLYQLSRRIHDARFLHNLPEVNCMQGMAEPIVYLRSKNFDKNARVSFYLAYRYKHVEIFSSWHGETRKDIPIYFESCSGSYLFYFRDFVREDELEANVCSEVGMNFVASKRAWLVQISALWQVIHNLLKEGVEVWAEKFKIEELSSFEINAESGIGWFELKPFDRSSGQRIDPLQLIKYLKRQALFIRLGHDRVCVLPEHWILNLTRFLNISNLGEDHSWRFSSIYAAEVGEAIENETLKGIQKSFYQVKTLKQPEGLRVILRPYQLEGLTWLNLLCDLHVGGILADDMGLGKTVQILALLQHKVVNQSDLSPQKIMVVCPKSVQAHWFSQAKNLVPRLHCHILKASDLSFSDSYPQHILFLASYGLIRHNADAFLKWNFDILIIDEAQMIKNHSSQITQIIKKLSATQRFALTGTPIENRFEELVSIFNFLNPYAQLDLGSELINADTVRSLLRRALHPFVLRRLKEDVLTDLPPKLREDVSLPMHPEQERLHQELLEVYRNEMAKRQDFHELPTESEAAFFLEGLLRLRQVATYPQQLMIDNFDLCFSNKLEYLCQKIPELIKNGHRIVVFSQFLGFLRSLADSMKTLGIHHSYVDGETPERERTIFLFQSNTTIKVLLISLRVGGLGIDLTSADVCIIADPWWNEAVENQAIDRLHRFGQKKPVMILRLVSTGSIEEKMEILKRNKTELADALGKTNPDFLKSLRWENFADVFR